MRTVAPSVRFNPMTKSSQSPKALIPVALVERRIYLIRGEKVMIDNDLAKLYDVPTHRLNEAVKRNRNRFPSDFMFQLNKKEAASLISQFAISKSRRGGRRTLPYAFTEQGVAMLSSVLRSERAIQVNVVIMRVFVKLRQMLESNEDLNRKFTAIVRKLAEHDKYFTVVFHELKKLTNQPKPKRRRIGFTKDNVEALVKKKPHAD